MKYFVSYAQNYEDVMLHRALKHVQRGFYIDVGAQDPDVDSVTKAFYERGWCGINIEPVEHWYQRLCDDRPHDINLRVAVSDHAGEITLYESDQSGLSTSESTFADDARARGWTLTENHVPCVTLEQICTEHAVETVHFLKVDCEGAEEQALRGMPLQHVRPWIVLVESTEPNSSRPTHQHWEHLLTGNRYEFVYFDGINRYYIAHEHAELRESFAAPPHVFDWFQRAEEARAHRRVQELHKDLLEARAIERSARAEAERDHWLRENERREKALEHSRQSITTLQTQASDLIAEITRLRGEIIEAGKLQGAVRSLNAEITRLRGEVSGFGSEISRLQQEYRDNVAERDRLRTMLAQVLASRSWRVTRPLRVLNRGVGAMLRGSKRGAKAALRGPARRARPALRRLSSHPAARKAAIAVLGRDSAIIRRIRIFLFGPPRVIPPHAIARAGDDLDPQAYSRRERIALQALLDAVPDAQDERKA